MARYIGRTNYLTSWTRKYIVPCNHHHLEFGMAKFRLGLSSFSFVTNTQCLIVGEIFCITKKTFFKSHRIFKVKLRFPPFVAKQLTDVPPRERQ